MNKLCTVLLGGLLLALPACYSVDHFAGDPTDYDGLYFGPSEGAGASTVSDDTWRIYWMFGLLSYNSDTTRWAGDRLSRIDSTQRPMKIVVTNKMTFVNGLAAVGAAFVGGPFQLLLFVPRTTEVAAR